jgi:hypothetical protein
MRKRVIKLIVAVLCMMAFCMPIVAYAEDVPPVDVTTTAPDETTPPEDVVAPPADDVVPPADTAPDTTVNESNGFSWDEVKDTFSTTVVVWVQAHIEEIGVVVALIGYGITLINKFKTLNKSMGTMNNNAITMAKDSSSHMSAALTSMQNTEAIVTKYEERILELLETFKNTAVDRKKLETEIVELKEYLRVSTTANKEFANELAELLALANIPNYKKEEIGARHRANLLALEEAELHAEHVADALVEVKENDGEEA